VSPPLLLLTSSLPHISQLHHTSQYHLQRHPKGLWQHFEHLGDILLRPFVSRLFTMSSSSATTSLMSATSLSRPISTSKYRIAEYHDGNVLRIHESRRHSHVTGLANPSTPTRHARSLEVQASHLTTEIPSSSMRSPHDTPNTRIANRSRERELRLSKHMISISHPSPRANAIVFQSPIPLRPKTKAYNPLVESSGMPTPPSTPKIGRLATPELEDLNEVPFCDCCVHAHLIKYCASCGSGLHQF